MFRFIRMCAVFAAVVLSSSAAYSQLSQNSSINGADTWVTIDMSIAINGTINLPNPIYNAATKTSSNTLTMHPATQTFHVEAGYDASGGLVMNLWPKGAPVDPINSDGNPLGFIRFAAGQMTIFDQGGSPLPALLLQGMSIPTNWSLNMLGSNPGPSVISNLVVPNISNYSANTRAQLAYGTPSSTAYVTNSMSDGSTARWTYTQSGSNWIAQQVVLSPTVSAGTSTRTVQFSNLSWFDNSSNDSVRAARGYTATPLPTSGSMPTVTTGTPAGSSTTVAQLGGPQNVVFMHGMLSNGTTWDRMEPWLNRDFRFGTELTPSYSSTSSLSSQGTTLVNDITTNGGAGYILIGHSQGGLISRYAAQYFQTHNPNRTSPAITGVVSVDTPHKGADLILSGSSLSPDLQYLALLLWYWTRCVRPGDNGACFLAWMEYNAGPYIGKGFDIASGFPDLKDMTPGSSFLTSLNGYNENFIRAGIVGNTSQRWNESRLAWDFLAPYDGIEVACDPNYYPEGGCGERAVATVVGVTYDIVEALLAFAILEEIFDPNGNYIPDILEYSGILFFMNGIDFYWNFVVTGGFYDSSDAIVQSTSQNYPSISATQYPINGSDSHVENTHSPYDHTTLYQVLAGPQFKAPTQASCEFSVSPSSDSVPASGGTGTFGLAGRGRVSMVGGKQCPLDHHNSGKQRNFSGKRFVFGCGEPCYRASFGNHPNRKRRYGRSFYREPSSRLHLHSNAVARNPTTWRRERDSHRFNPSWMRVVSSAKRDLDNDNRRRQRDRIWFFHAERRARHHQQQFQQYYYSRESDYDSSCRKCSRNSRQRLGNDYRKSILY